jgi:predicted signal transduction protein with EAL and GGDEF domain
MPGRDEVTDLLRRADEAVLAAKRAGGNHIAVASDNSLKQRFRSDIEGHLKGDIDNDSLLLDYLPEVDLWTGAIVAAEALVRWRHPDRGVLLPDSFIGVAESMNRASDLDRWVLRTACAEFSGWRSRGVGRDASLRVNVSPLQLTAPGFVAMVGETIAEFGMDDRSLYLEITERAVVNDIDIVCPVRCAGGLVRGAGTRGRETPGSRAAMCRSRWPAGKVPGIGLVARRCDRCRLLS